MDRRTSKEGESMSDTTTELISREEAVRLIEQSYSSEHGWSNSAMQSMARKIRALPSVQPATHQQLKPEAWHCQKCAGQLKYDGKCYRCDYCQMMWPANNIILFAYADLTDEMFVTQPATNSVDVRAASEEIYQAFVNVTPDTGWTGKSVRENIAEIITKHVTSCGCAAKVAEPELQIEPHDCYLVAHDTGDGWALGVESHERNVVAYLEWPADWPDAVSPSFLREKGYKIV
jgi:hypothetical protein